MATENITPDLESIEKELVNPQIRISRSMFHLGTPQNHFVLRGVGITRKDKSPSKKNRKISAKSAKINRNKKRHHMTAKEKKSR